MAEAVPKWLKGQLVGTCLGKPTRRKGGTGLARWYQLTLVDAVISDWAPVAGPPASKEAEPAPFCQAQLADARLRSRTPGGDDEALSLRELSVWDWKLRDQREAGGESRCTLHGTVYAREVDGTRRPAALDAEGRLAGWGCLALIAAALVGFWLWWRCGPFTCGFWAAAIAASGWTRWARTRRRTPPTTGSKVLQGALALLLVTAGAALVLALNDTARAATCGHRPALGVLLALDLVLAGALFTVRWPLPWLWVVWTAVIALWCGRPGADCARSWLDKGKAAVTGAAQPQPQPPGQPALPHPVAPHQGGAKASGGADAGASVGSGGAGRPSGEGSGGGELPTGAMENRLGAPPPGSLRPPRGPSLGPGRMSVEAALSDPDAFLDGSQRVTLLGDLLFDFDEDTLRPDADQKLRPLAELLERHPGTRVLLEGHADTIGGDQYNQTLSERRAEAVRAWLVEQAHLSPNDIDTVGYGSSQPIVPASASPVEQRKNRRVEVRVLR